MKAMGNVAVNIECQDGKRCKTFILLDQTYPQFKSRLKEIYFQKVY